MTPKYLTAWTIPCAAALLLALSSPSHAWLAGLFSGSDAIDCTPRDRTCILETALSIQIADYQNREHKPNFEPHAQAAALLMQFIPDGERDAVRKRWEEAGADDEFIRSMDYSLRIALPPEGVTVETLRTALLQQSAPDGEDFAEFMRKAFPVILKDDPQAAVALWEEHTELLWKNAYPAFTDTLHWIALNEVDAFERMAEKYLIPKSALYDGWDRLSRVAATHCNAGDSEKGERILAVLDQERALWTPDQELQAIEWSKMTYGVLHCRGEAAMAMIDPLFAQMETDIAAVEAKYTDERERAFAIGVIRSEVAENLIQTITLRLNDEGRVDEARELYARLPSQVTSATADSLVNDGILGMEFENDSFDDMIEFQSSATYYNDDPNVALNWYVASFKPTFETCCVEKQYVQEAAEKVGAAWPSAVARQAAAKTLALMDQLQTQDPTSNGPEDKTLATLRFAAFERLSDGCDLTDERLTELLSEIAAYESGSSKGTALRAYLGFLDAQPSTGDAACTIT
ncbi:hypothetical protein [Mesorhizobium sp. CAU 1732]|uniref:hypothetical protein n=1 Tax=Mesorhizobium sp. CAU 1732 TaxID=3140358 RepID=UPI003260490B